MDATFKAKLEELGADVDNTVHRFMGKETLYLNFLGKFQKDQSFSNIERYLEEQNAEEAFKAAHTLKGVAANLGLDPIANSASDLTELFRGKQQFSDVDMEKLEKTKTELHDTYYALLKVITEYFQ